MGRPLLLSSPRTTARCSLGKGHRETEAVATSRTVTNTTRAAPAAPAALLAPAADPPLQAQHDAVGLTESVSVDLHV